MRGNVSGSFASGYWYEPGSAFYYSEETLPTYGTWSVTLAPNNNSFNGTFYYGEDNLTPYPYFETRIDSLSPTVSQCWYSGSDASSLKGEYSLKVEGLETTWAVCDAGETYYYSSYTYVVDGEQAGFGFSQGLIRDGIYRGDWTQGGYQAGVELVAPFEDGIRSTWWQGGFDIAYVDNSFSHLVDDYTFKSSKVSQDECFEYFSSFGSATSLQVSLAAFFMALALF